MYLTFNSAPGDIELVRSPDTDGGKPRRIVAGQALPYNKVARVNGGQLVKFLPGSVNAAGAPVVRDHDYTRPVGVVVDASDTEHGHNVAARLSATAGGDESLTLAADGVLTGWSVGASADEYSWDNDGAEPVLVVSAATVRELSLLVNPAFGADSQVTDVAANAGHEPTTEETNPMDTITIDPPADVNASTGPVDIVATAPAPVRVKSEPELTAAQYAVEMILAQRGDAAAARVIEAALTANDELTNPGILPPQYVAGILGGYMPYRPAYASVAHGTLPSAGNDLVRPKWASLPKVAKYAGANTDPPTGAVNIGNVQVPKQAWAHAVLASIALINRSDPGYAAEYFRAAVESFYVELDADIAATIVSDVTPNGEHDNALNVIATAVQNAVVAQTVSGVFVGYWPEWALVGMNVWGALVGASAFSGPAYGTGTANIDTPQGTVSGISVRACPAIDPDLCIAGHPAYATAYTSPNMDLRALVVNTMSVELGFYTDTALMVNNDNVLGAATYAPAGGARVVKTAK